MKRICLLVAGLAVVFGTAGACPPPREYTDCSQLPAPTSKQVRKNRGLERMIANGTIECDYNKLTRRWERDYD